MALVPSVFWELCVSWYQTYQYHVGTDVLGLPPPLPCPFIYRSAWVVVSSDSCSYIFISSMSSVLELCVEVYLFLYHVTRGYVTSKFMDTLVEHPLMLLHFRWETIPLQIVCLLYYCYHFGECLVFSPLVFLSDRLVLWLLAVCIACNHCLP